MHRFQRAGLALALVIGATACVSTQDDEYVRAKAWDQVRAQTEVTQVSGTTLRVSAGSAITSDIEALELEILTRAAGEAVRREAPRFALVFVQYNRDSVTRWIGSYENLLDARTDADLDGSLQSPFGSKRITAVVRFLGPDDEAARMAFDSADTYRSLLSDRIERKNIRAPRRLWFQS